MLSLEQAVDAVQRYYDARCRANGAKHAVVDVCQAVENPSAGVFILRIKESCLCQFGTRCREVAVDVETGGIKAINQWRPSEDE